MTGWDAQAFAAIRAALDPYVFRPTSERDLQAQVAEILARDRGLQVRTEVASDRGRYDVQVHHRELAKTVVLELKLSASVAAVERQAQRYALADGVDAVAVVTTSRRLALRLVEVGGATLGGKPFTAIALRTL